MWVIIPRRHKFAKFLFSLSRHPPPPHLTKLFFCIFKALEERNKLRKKVGKNKIAPQAQTDLDVKIEKTERIETVRKESPTSWDIFTVEKKDEIVAGDIEEKEAELKSKQSVGSDSTTRSLEEKAGGDTALCKFIVFHYAVTPCTGEYMAIWGAGGGPRGGSTHSIH